MARNPRQVEISELIKEKGAKKTVLAERLGMTKQNIDYHLSKDSDLDDELYNNFLQILDPERFVEQKIESIRTEYQKRMDYLIKQLMDKDEEIRKLKGEG